jgi:hypothetical protein
MTKAILIDPRDLSVRYVDCVPAFGAMQELIGGDLEIAHVFPSGDVLYVDEEGLTKDLRPGPDDKATCFCIHAHQVFAGRGLIVGEDESGQPCDVTVTVPEIMMRIRFAFPRP